MCRSYHTCCDAGSSGNAQAGNLVEVFVEPGKGTHFFYTGVISCFISVRMSLKSHHIKKPRLSTGRFLTVRKVLILFA